MARSVAFAVLAAAAAVGALDACTTGPGREDVGIQRLQTLLCERALECGCRPPTDDLGQPIACGDWSPPPLGEHDPRPGGRDPLAFDPECVERWESWVEGLSCQPAQTPSYADLCPLYHGVLREGEACDGSDDVTESECGRGLFCLAGVCRNPERTRFGGEGEPCDFGLRCDQGLACVGFAVCQRLPGPGEPCIDGYLCNAASRCDFTTCVALPGPGERCDGGECVAGSYCALDPASGVSECRLTMAVGEPCQGHRQCASGNCPAGYCEAPAGAGDPCGSQLPCGPGLVCDGGTCQASAGGLSTCDLFGGV